MIVDGTPITMALQKTIRARGRRVRRQHNTGTRAAHLSASKFGDGTNTWQLPLNGVPFTGPQVTPFDLDTIKVTPAASVLARSPADDQRQVRLPRRAPADGRTGPDRQRATPPLATAGTNPKTGITYSYTTSALSQGDHYFDLQFNDGSGIRTFEEFTTPPVTPIDLLASTVTPTSGTSTTAFTFTTQYVGNQPRHPGSRSRSTTCRTR